jgi:hypothetical protein
MALPNDDASAHSATASSHSDTGGTAHDKGDAASSSSSAAALVVAVGASAPAAALAGAAVPAASVIKQQYRVTMHTVDNDKRQSSATEYDTFERAMGGYMKEKRALLSHLIHDGNLRELEERALQRRSKTELELGYPGADSDSITECIDLTNNGRVLTSVFVNDVDNEHFQVRLQLHVPDNHTYRKMKMPKRRDRYGSDSDSDS